MFMPGRVVFVFCNLIRSDPVRFDRADSALTLIINHIRTICQYCKLYMVCFMAGEKEVFWRVVVVLFVFFCFLPTKALISCDGPFEEMVIAACPAC